MMTDTGGFTFNSNNPEIFEIISLLLRKKIDKDAIYSQVYHNFSEAVSDCSVSLSQRWRFIPIYTQHLYLSKEDQAQFSFRRRQRASSIILNIKGIIFSTFIREDDGLIKLSFRSQHTFPCNEFAAEFFNGGGHLNASGGEHYGTFEEALHIYREGLKAYESKLKETMMLL